MWYHILPTAAIIMFGIEFPRYIMPKIHNLICNNPLHRILVTPMSRHLFLRDERLTDNPWAAGDEGLKNIPDD